MPRYQITLSDGTILTFGWDLFLGFFTEVRMGRRRVLDYDAMQPDYNGLPGLLDALVSAGVFSQDQKEAGLDALLSVPCTDEIKDEYARAVAVIAHNLKRAAGE